MPPPPEHDHAWAVRVLARGPEEARAYCRTHVFSVGRQASLHESDPHPSAVEYLLGALGGDLVRGLQVEAVRRSLIVHALELSLTGRLQNVLAHLGVIGEEGHPGLASITGTLYVSTDADEEALGAAWHAALARSPLFHTLSRGVALTIELRVAP